ncbi:hypothetical protein [Scytonema sp. NUACC26]|uniref:hypothetical protein n=1 Tax=Scytonema sp. NUACC26 TaxID=3140176 RepID=UPI0034DBE9D5
MKSQNSQFLVALIGSCLFLSSSNLLAKETSQQLNLNQRLLAQSDSNLDVSKYLQNNKPGSYNFLKNKLNEAIENAKRPDREKVVNNLWELSINNSRIKTRINNGKLEFLMASWKYVKNPNEDWKPGLKQINNQTWLTVSNQVKEFCNTCKGLGINIPGNIMLSLRLQQYLGLILNKNSNKTHFVEMWVKAEDLSRPCIDPEINDSSCQVLPVPVPDSHSNLQKIYKNSYEGNGDRYPWTGLGYTYDWGNPQKPHVGASEFLINPEPGKSVEVELVSVTPTQEYCNNQYLR